MAIECYKRAKEKFNIDSTDVSKTDIEYALKKLQ